MRSATSKGIHAFHVDDPHQVEDAHLDAPHVHNAETTAGSKGRKIGRAQERLTGIKEFIGFLAAEGVVPSGNHIHAAVKQKAGGGGRNPVPIGGVFPVCNDEVHPLNLFQLGQMCP